MPANIQDVLAYEIKKEIAERYFGFRKLIEEDSLDMKEKLNQYSFILEKRISFDLIRIYILLHEDNIIKEFMAIINLEKTLFYDPYLLESKTIRARVFQGVKLRGFTLKGRYNNLFFDILERLAVHINQYKQKYEELMASHDLIEEEIKIFHRDNDLGTILGFLHSLGNNSSRSTMQGGLETGIAEKLEKKLAFTNSEVNLDKIAIINPLPPIDSIRSQIKNLLSTAYKRNSDEFRTFFAELASAPEKLPR